MCPRDRIKAMAPYAQRSLADASMPARFGVAMIEPSGARSSETRFPAAGWMVLFAVASLCAGLGRRLARRGPRRAAPRLGRAASAAPRSPGGPSPALRPIGVGLLALLALLLPASAEAQAGQTVEYYHLDALGSVRVVTDQNAQVIARHDFLPFGEEWNPPTNAPEKKLFTGQPPSLARSSG
jgi:hypothetical protein